MTNYEVTFTEDGTIYPDSIDGLAIGDTLTLCNGTSYSADVDSAEAGASWNPSSATIAPQGVQTLTLTEISEGEGSIHIDVDEIGLPLLLRVHYGTVSVNVPVKIRDKWRNAKPYVRTGGDWTDPVWSEVTKAWMKVDGVWKRLDCPIVAPSPSVCMYLTSSNNFSFSVNTYRGDYGTEVYGTVYFWAEDYGSAWTRCTKGTTYSISANKSVYFWNPNNRFTEPVDGYWKFTITGGNVSVGGDISSLVNHARGLEDASHVCFRGLFKDCTNITNASALVLPYLDLTEVNEYVYSELFMGCTSLTSLPSLSATTLGSRCYEGMFEGCTSLTSAPPLPLTTLAQYCYAWMFEGCTSLTSAPPLPLTTLAQYCYAGMFKGCTSLTSAPSLSATTLRAGCYYAMFEGCTSLTSAPSLPATSVYSDCYERMFYGCTNLIDAPSLPATSVGQRAYQSMFEGCTSLTSAPPSLPTTELEGYCYARMFYGCINLVYAPSLPATTLERYCYSYMFYGCSSLTVNVISGKGIMNFTNTATSAVTNMFTGTGGEFTGTPVAGTTYYNTCCVWRELSATATGPVYGYTQTGTISGGTYLPTMWTLKLSSAPSIRRNATFDFDSASSTCQIRTSNTPVGSYCCSNSDNIKTSGGSRDSGMVSPSYVANITSISDNTIWGKLVSATVSATIYGVGVARYITGASASATVNVLFSKNSSAYPSYGVQDGKFYIRVDHNSPFLTYNKSLNVTDGSLVDCNGWAVTDYIEIPTNCTTVNVDGNGTNSGYSVLCEYNSSKAFVDYWGAGANPRTITLTGAYTKYVRFSFKLENVDKTSGFTGKLTDSVNNVVLFG